MEFAIKFIFAPIPPQKIQQKTKTDDLSFPKA